MLILTKLRGPATGSTKRTSILLLVIRSGLTPYMLQFIDRLRCRSSRGAEYYHLTAASIPISPISYAKSASPELLKELPAPGTLPKYSFDELIASPTDAAICLISGRRPDMTVSLAIWALHHWVLMEGLTAEAQPAQTD
jgi:hypothetical protein